MDSIGPLKYEFDSAGRPRWTELQRGGSRHRQQTAGLVKEGKQVVRESARPHQRHVPVRQLQERLAAGLLAARRTLACMQPSPALTLLAGSLNVQGKSSCCQTDSVTDSGGWVYIAD